MHKYEVFEEIIMAKEKPGALEVKSFADHHVITQPNPLRKMLRFSFDAITSFSSAPLQWATFLGFVFSGVAFLAIPLAIVARYTNIYERGVPSIVVVVLLGVYELLVWACDRLLALIDRRKQDAVYPGTPPPW